MPTANEDAHTEALERFDKAMSSEHEDRLLMEEDFAFAAGEQWPDIIKREREATDRPCLTFNRLPTFIHQVVGDARQNKPAIKVHPIDEGADSDTAEIYEGLIRNIESQSQADIAYMTAFEYAVTGGQGAFRIVTEYASDDTFDQDIRINRINDPFSVAWDHNAKKYDKSDAKFCFVSEWITKEAFELEYPDHIPADWSTVYTGSFTRHWANADRVRIAEYWCKKPVTKTLAQMPDGGVIEVPKGVALERFAKTRVVDTHEVVRYVMSGQGVISGPEVFPSRYIPIVPVFGPEEFIEGRIRHRSLIRYAKDPQRMYNFWQTTIAEKIALAPKSPWLVTLDQVKGLESFWNAANRSSKAYLPYNPDPQAPGAPQRQEPAYVNAAEIQQSAQAIEDLKSTMGIYDASLGAQGNETSGRAIIARQREGDTATFAWIDNLSRSIEHAGKILVDMIPRIYDTQRVVRVMGEDDSDKMVEINTLMGGETVHDLTVGKYDVAISVGPSYATKRLEAADSMLAFIQAFPAAAEITGDLIAKNMDWPGADDMAERLKKLLPPGMADDEDMSEEERQAVQQQAEEAKQKEAQMFELEVTDRQADIELKRSNAAKALQDARAQDVETDAVESGIMDLLNGQA